ncbi:MAG: acyl-CoA thioesterase [Candidatus Merdivicinus sp.]|jgi:acyl-CoA thioester hydrolase
MTTETHITVRYAETDQMGITHHSVYPIWFEAARTDWIKQLGLTYSQLEKMGVMTPLAQLECRYAGVSRYEDELIIRCFVTEFSPARIRFGYEVIKQGEEKPICTGSTLHAWVDSQTFRPVSMKKRFPDLYAKLGTLTEPPASSL